MNQRVFIKRNIEFLRCPSCRAAASLKKSRTRSAYERIVKYLDVRAYVCTSCGWRGRYFKYTLGRNGLKMIILYIAVLVFVALFVRYMLNKMF